MENDNLYARWLKGSLTEKAQLKASGDLEILERIASETESWTLPDMREGSYGQLKEKIWDRKSGSGKTKTVSINQYAWISGIAASLLIASVYWLFFRTDTITYQCEAGQKIEIFLPDKTPVILSGNSSISYNPEGWEEKREVELKGNFTVSFDQGNLKVLGTRFEILSGKDIATVKCFEGKILVSDKKGDTQLLIEGKGTRLYNNKVVIDTFSVTGEVPQWLTGESLFDNAPLIEVINALSVQYDIDFDADDIDMNRRYSGKFVHSSQEDALNMVFSPMGIKYNVKGIYRKKVVLSQ
jgi:ferric-dicitrate binding protein FerR (iron transport regulator)